MKVLLAGAYRYFWYEEACERALKNLGMEMNRFSWSHYFSGFTGRIEHRMLLPGVATWRFERDLLAAAARQRPDVIWIWRGTQIRPSLLRRLKRETGALLVSYNNDDPFGPGYDKLAGWLKPNIWRLFTRSIKEYDINFVFRSVNVEEYGSRGAGQVELLLPYFIRDLHRPLDLSRMEQERYGCDLVFVGHCEDDGRIDCLRALVAQGYSVRLFGNGWPATVVRKIYGSDIAIRPALGEDYVKALCGAKLCLSFLSKLNRDTYTRRSFEIPACGKVMVSERTNDLMALFRDGEEAAYFSNAGELLAVVGELLANENKRRSMEFAARRRSLSSGYDVEGRMKNWLETVESHPSLWNKGRVNAE